MTQAVYMVDNADDDVSDQNSLELTNLVLGLDESCRKLPDC